ncbi:hypothetical protein B0H19DRAFT_1254110 [Mycena capillaripes]|nr:hypothetical protein B0H19DRAFT_1254110 [Mycena capillaripes]
MSILDLSAELLQEISYRIPADHKHLRVACKNLNLAVAPAFFSTVSLNVHKSRLGLSLEHLEALATGNTPWSTFTHTLTIKHLSASLEDAEETDEMEEHTMRQHDTLQQMQDRLRQCLLSALQSLKNVRTVLWGFSASTEESTWVAQTVEHFLASLPLPDDLRLAAGELNFGRNWDCSFDGLAGLRRLTLTSSDSEVTALRRISRSMSRAWRHPPLHGLGDLFPDLTQPIRLTELRLFRYSLRLDPGTISHLLWIKG